MSDDARARIRDQLAAATAGDDSDQGAHRGAGRLGRWTAPAVAAAAVVAVVLGVFAVGAVREDSSGPGGDSLRPAAPSTGAPGTDSPTPTTAPPATTTPPQPTPSRPAPTTSGAGTGSPTPSKLTVPSTTFLSPFPPPRLSLGPPEPLPSTVGPGDPGVPTGSVPATSCVQEIARAAEPSLRGAAVSAERDYGPGTIYLYETKTAWVVCDDLSATDGGAPTLLSFHDKARRYEPYAVTTGVSENLITNSDGNWVYDQFVAGGRDFDGVEAITYVFPDGHVEDAVVGRNGMWSMVYLATDGVFMDPNTNETRLDPIKVRVRYTGGGIHTFNLRWGLDTCAQLNHGC